MTAEPKFVPEEAVEITMDGGATFSVRLIDCVGYMVNGAIGQFEGDAERMVTTPWFDHDIPLTEAAEVGTRKVISEHSTIGIVITTDGYHGHRADQVSNRDEGLMKWKPFLVVIPVDRRTGEVSRQLEILRIALGPQDGRMTSAHRQTSMSFSREGSAGGKRPAIHR